LSKNVRICCSFQGSAQFRKLKRSLPPPRACDLVLLILCKVTLKFSALQTPALSALVKPGMKAVTIRVNDVEGVGGFVLPGDHVDAVLTRQLEKGNATTQVVLQNTRVLAVDQTADERAAKATVAKSVTLEVDTVDAQKLWLASSVGSLSLLLRKAGETAEIRTRKVTLNDLGTNEPVSTDKAATVTVVVTRASAKQEYSVPAEGTNGASVATERRQVAW
jgi:pilus assembly protein CpaB